MNRIDICKNIIQSINEYITNPDKLEPHREKNHFIRKRKLSLFQVILYLLFSLWGQTPLTLQVVCHESSSGQQLPFVPVLLLECSFPEAHKKKAAQLPASALTSVDLCPVPLFHMPLLSGDVCGNIFMGSDPNDAEAVCSKIFSHF